MEVPEECRKYPTELPDSPLGYILTLLLFVGVPLLFFGSLISGTGSNIIWTGMLAVISAFSIILPNITLMGYAPLSYPDPNIILKRCQDYWSALKKKSEIEKLERVYSRAVEGTFEGFKMALLGWIGSGVGLTIIEYGLLTGNLQPSWITSLSVFLFAIMGPINFILVILTYLRYRKYSRQLFAIQLKKSDKAEISIKI